MGKCCGLRPAKKLGSHRRDQKWHDKQYKKAHLGTALKANPFGGASHAKGIVLGKVGVEAKQPNSAIRKCVRVQLIKNRRKITAFVPHDGYLNFTEENDEVLVDGFGRKGHAVISQQNSLLYKLGCFNFYMAFLTGPVQVWFLIGLYMIAASVAEEFGSILNHRNESGIKECLHISDTLKFIESVL
ncbi:40S ribosomal protein S23 [Podarcis lilfordi]|uniref:Small ribosomal subunit protein uS12 n=1 Tax=Podarcis lilfordi TaxID=74358 RepID=A0AA35KTL6_9SAUR|nr:40S ribosomal protein S23 [Podarcis lilfordi]